MGINILLDSSENPGDVGTHADYQGLAPYPEMMFSKDTLMFTAILSISTPRQGGGLRVWPKRHTADSIPNKTFFKTGYSDLDYTVGGVTIIDSFFYHKVNGFVLDEAHPERMVGVIHFLYRKTPTGAFWEHWF
jgi:hypothetical protein